MQEDSNNMALEELLSDIKERVDTKGQTEKFQQEFLQAFSKVLDIFDALKKDSAKEMADNKALIAEAARQMNERVAAIKDGESPKDEQLLALIKPLIPPAIPGESPAIEQIVPEVLAQLELPEQRDIVMDGPDEIRNKLELLQGDERLDIKYIKGIDEYDKRLYAIENRPNVGGWSSGGGGKIAKYYDLSPLLNGVTKTFSLPAFWRVINIQSSSSPNPMRENTDFTVDGTLFQVTFLAGVDASTVLAAGQTILALYTEP